MIGRIHKRGSKVGGLVRYLFGPGKREEHVEPRVVAGWLDPKELEPAVTAKGEKDLGRLISELEQPVVAAGVDPAKRVWHCSLRNAATDRILTDTEWGDIAREVMAKVGLAGSGDTPGVRWVAVRHNDDHIHIVATLVRENGRIEKGWNDQYKLRDACQEIERKYGLTVTAPADKTAARRPALAELSKAARAGRGETWREQLRREVRIAAAASTRPEEFIEHLQSAGVMVKVRHSIINPDEMTGYAVSLPGHKTQTGELVYYSGGKLAADLSLPKLRQRWGGQPAAGERPVTQAEQHSDRDRRAQLLHQATAAVDRAAAEIRTGADTGTLGQAGSDVLTTVIRASNGPRSSRLWTAAEHFDRAVRDNHTQPDADPFRARQLRALSRQLAKAGRISGRSDQKAALLLMDSLARLSDSVAELRRAQDRLHQAEDARRASAALREHATKGLQAHAPAVAPVSNREQVSRLVTQPSSLRQQHRSR